MPTSDLKLTPIDQTPRLIHPMPAPDLIPVTYSRPAVRHHYSRTKVGETTGISGMVIMMAILITSYFYCLPLTRYSIIGIQTDFRMYDVVMFVCMFRFLAGYNNRIDAIVKDRKSYFYWGSALLVMVGISLIFTFFYSGYKPIMTVFIRTYRFSGYIMTGAMMVVAIRNGKNLKFLLLVFYINILIQAILSWAQTLNLIPPLWPKYWLDNYETWSKAVGTLSPHHKHISIVMLFGIVLSLSYLKTQQLIIRKIFVLISLVLMTAVPFFVGARSAWLGLVAVILGYTYIHKMKGILILTAVGLTFVLAYTFSGDQVSDHLDSVIDIRMMDRLEQKGFEGISRDRKVIWTDMFVRGLQKAPYVLITGTGFQNISFFLGATGAHNNFLNVFLELGLIGLIIFVMFLYRIYTSLYLISGSRHAPWNWYAKDGRVAMIGLLATMMVGESLWAQYSMFTLSGQIMAYFGIISAPLYWSKQNIKKPTQSSIPMNKVSVVKNA